MEERNPSPERGWRKALEVHQGRIWNEAHSIWQHSQEYPYVWASYAVVFGTLGLYSAYAWRGMRRAENEVLRLQEEVRRKLAQKAALSQTKPTEGISKTEMPP